jgi:hypothetical protein
MNHFMLTRYPPPKTTKVAWQAARWDEVKAIMNPVMEERS